MIRPGAGPGVFGRIPSAKPFRSINNDSAGFFAHCAMTRRLPCRRSWPGTSRSCPV